MLQDLALGVYHRLLAQIFHLHCPAGPQYALSSQPYLLLGTITNRMDTPLLHFEDMSLEICDETFCGEGLTVVSNALI